MILSNWTRAAEEEEREDGGGGGAVLQQAATLADVILRIRWSDCLNIRSHQGLLATVKNVLDEARDSELCCYLCHAVCVVQRGESTMICFWGAEAQREGSATWFSLKRLTADQLKSNITRYCWII